jgi:hypothetical protein
MNALVGGCAMPAIFGFFNGENAIVMASIVAFTAFFLIGRVAQARQGVAFAFAFTPWLAFIAIMAAAGLLL